MYIVFKQFQTNAKAEKQINKIKQNKQLEDRHLTLLTHYYLCKPRGPAFTHLLYGSPCWASRLHPRLTPHYRVNHLRIPSKSDLKNSSFWGGYLNNTWQKWMCVYIYIYHPNTTAFTSVCIWFIYCSAVAKLRIQVYLYVLLLWVSLLFCTCTNTHTCAL